MNENNAEHPYNVGDKLFIRAITFHYIGQIDKIYKKGFLLANASWIADSGRFYNALKDGELDEVEPYPNKVFILFDSIVDITKWIHALPTMQK